MKDPKIAEYEALLQRSLDCLTLWDGGEDGCALRALQIDIGKV